MIRKLVLLLLLVPSNLMLPAQSPAKLYLQVLTACSSGPDEKKVVWLGTSNQYGPGTVWALPNTGPSILVPSNRYFKTQADLNNALNSAETPPKMHQCNSVKSPEWKVGADVPINVATIGGGEATASLNSSSDITITATSVSWVGMPRLTMEDAINALNHTQDSAFWRIADGKSYALLSAYSVTGLQLTYTLNKNLDVGVKAQIVATPSVNIGNSTTPLNASVSVSNDGQKVTITIPDTEYMFGEMTPVGMLSPKQIATGRLMLGTRNWVTSCRSAGLC